MTDIVPVRKTRKGIGPQNIPRNNEILRQVIYEKRTLEDVGAEYGMSRQAVEQICNKIDPVAYKLYMRNCKASARIGKVANTGPLIISFCKLCGKEITKELRHSYCCDSHYHIYRDNFLYHLLDGRKHGHQLAVARWAERKDFEGMSEVQKRYFQRLLAGAEISRKGEWLNEGGKVKKYAIKAYKEKWPIFNKLPAQIQAQIIREVEGF